MSKLDEASKRLQNAVSALEAAARARPPAESQPRSDGAGDDSALAELNARNAELEKRNAEIAVRLDSAIGQIKQILDS